MSELSQQERAVELLQQLGLKEYEAKAFVALSRLPRGTAKDISEVSEVPRTRVYDAVRVLETKGLVEVQHSNPQEFRAVSIDEAVQTLRSEYENRAESLQQMLQGMDSITAEDDTDVTHEVWALAGEAAITNRTHQLIDEADEEVLLVIGHEDVFTDDLVDAIEAAKDRGVTVIIGTVSESLGEHVEDRLPDTAVFVSGLDWLRQSTLPGDETEISRLLLADREDILVSTFVTVEGDGHEHEQAVFGRGFDNGLVTIVRRLMATGLLGVEDPGDGEA